jgi:hypothetical protein
MTFRLAILASATIAAVALVACSSVRGVSSGHSAGPDALSGDGGPSIIPGAPCTSPGWLYCEEGAGALVLFCGSVSGTSINLGTETFQTVFQCPPAQVCSVDQGHTSVECGPVGAANIESYALEGGPCDEEQQSACSFDATKSLLCSQGVWRVTQTCNGANCGLIPAGAPGCSAPAGSKGCITCI